MKDEEQFVLRIYNLNEAIHAILKRRKTRYNYEIIWSFQLRTKIRSSIQISPQMYQITNIKYILNNRDHIKEISYNRKYNPKGGYIQVLNDELRWDLMKYLNYLSTSITSLVELHPNINCSLLLPIIFLPYWLRERRTHREIRILRWWA